MMKIYLNTGSRLNIKNLKKLLMPFFITLVQVVVYYFIFYSYF